MRDCKNLSPEDEAKLVPSWIGHIADSSTEVNWYYKEDPDADCVRVLSSRTGDLLNAGGFLTQYVWSDLLPALAFFAANGRLPRRLSDGGGK